MKDRNIRKGDVVKISADYGIRGLTDEELAVWRLSPESKGFDDAGETKLPPNTVSEPVNRNSVYIVLRARCAPRFGWALPRKGMTLVTGPGQEFYVSRDDIHPVRW